MKVGKKTNSVPEIAHKILPKIMRHREKKASSSETLLRVVKIIFITPDNGENSNEGKLFDN